MRIATWNVNSLKARLEKVEWWLERAAPDVLLMQETKLTDDDAPVMPFAMLGYELVHHGEGRWNGVAIATRVGADDVVTNFDGRTDPRHRARRDRLARGGRLRPARRGPDGQRGRRPDRGRRRPDPGGQPVRAERRGSSGSSVLHRQAGLVRAAGGLARRAGRRRRSATPPATSARHDAPNRRGHDRDIGPAPPRRRPQRGADRRRRLGPGRGPRRDPRLGARAGGLPGAPRPRAGRRLPDPASRAGPLHLVGLPGRRLPEELRDADRPPPGGSPAWWTGSWTSRSTARRARASRSRPTMPRWSSTSTRPAGRSTPGWAGAEERIAARRGPAG